MKKNNKRNTVGSIITVLLLIAIAVFGANENDLYTSRANDEQTAQGNSEISQVEDNQSVQENDENIQTNGEKIQTNDNQVNQKNNEKIQTNSNQLNQENGKEIKSNGNYANQTAENINGLAIYTGDECISQIPNDNKLRVYCLDVGQGDSILVSNNGKNMLIDASTNDMGSKVVDYLKKLGISKIDYLVGTHPHEDHIGGLDNVIKSFDIGKIYMPKKSANTKTFEDVLDAISAKKLKVSSPSVGDKFSVGNAKCKVMCVNDNAEDTNESSIVIQMEFNGKKYLFTGDANSNNEKSRAWEQVDVLKVGHHGSSSSTSKKFLNETKPKIALISVGKGNTYGHPTESALKRLANIGAKVYRTDESGTIMILQGE